jgi:hypothetical protein
VGLGTYKLQGDDAYTATLAALNCGYRHIDTASIYKNHAMVGKAIRDNKLARAEVFVTSKISPYEQGAEQAIRATHAAINELGKVWRACYALPAGPAIVNAQVLHWCKCRCTCLVQQVASARQRDPVRDCWPDENNV